MASPKSWIGLWLCAVLVTVSGVALANADVAKLTKDSKKWAMQAGDIFLQQADTNLVALDANTGKELWKVKKWH